MYRVLMVDDDPSILEVNRKYFNSKGYDVCCAANARDAFAITRTAQLDCIVLDVDLPDLDGFELCDRIREISDLPIIFLSAYTQQQSRVRGLSVVGTTISASRTILRNLNCAAVSASSAGSAWRTSR